MEWSHLSIYFRRSNLLDNLETPWGMGSTCKSRPSQDNVSQTQINDLILLILMLDLAKKLGKRI